MKQPHSRAVLKMHLCHNRSLLAVLGEITGTYVYHYASCDVYFTLSVCYYIFTNLQHRIKGRKALKCCQDVSFCYYASLKMQLKIITALETMNSCSNLTFDLIIIIFFYLF